ncbi:hypothetical protein GGU10DRAFT_357775 [Lentinula aff. detonsa]|uniref:E3 ubiquitin-protein ligase listerin n=1 Tax=Lentinula aff. detonsa TaxID=2804958 RepID=A0AA38NLL8_9AGAR|nr:hypothetical protein GGU10DRAFT_357775 [Lentinula aff. detonsa]
MSKASKKAGQSSSYNSTEVGTNSHKTQLDGPSKSISAKKKKDGGGAKKKQNLSKKELKELEKQQRQKAYVAPTKPQPIRPDPLDSTGLAYVLPGELVIVLRNLGKKAVKTREKALEELDTGWVNSDRGKGKEAQEQILMDMLPVWLSHLPQLLLHASKRIRLATASVHRSFISIPAVSEQIKLQLERDSAESADAIGTWSLATNDVDPVVANVAAESWRQLARTSPSLLCREQITIYAQRAILDPGGLYAYLNPAPPSSSVSTPTLSHKDKLRLTQKNVKGKPPPTKGKPNPLTAKVSEDTSDLSQPQGFDGLQSDSLETDTDRDARIRVAGIGSLALFVSNSSLSITSVAAVWDILGDARLWSSLVGNDPGSFGFEQPPVRKVAWRLVGVVSGALGMFKETVSAATTHSLLADERVSRLLRILSFSVFHSAWNEQDVGVQGVMWPSLLRFLKDNPEAWQWEIENTASQMNVPRQSKDVDAELESGSESEFDFPDAENQDVAGKTTVSSPAASRAYQSLLSFLERGCNGSPIQAYPAIVIILSTIPSSILLASYSSKSRPLHSLPFNDLFSSFWAAVASTTITPNRLFSGSGADKAAKAFIETVLECLVFLVRRTVSQSQNGSSEMKVDTVGLSTLIKTQIKRVWEEVVGITGSSTTKDSNGEAKKLVLKLSPDVLGTAIVRALRGLRGIRLEGSLYDDAWETVAQLVRDCAGNVASGSSAASRSANDLSSFISSVLKALNSESVDSSDSTSSDVHRLLEDVFSLALDGCERILADFGSEGFGSLYLLTRLINAFGSDSTIGASNIIQHSVATRIDTLLIQNAYKLLSLRPFGEDSEIKGSSLDGKDGLELLATYLLRRESDRTSQSIAASEVGLFWLALLEQVVEQSHSYPDFEKVEVFQRLISLLNLLKSKRGGMEVVFRLKPITGELDEMVLDFARDTVTSGSSSSELNIVRDVLLLTHRTTIGEEISHPLITIASLVKLIDVLISRFEDGVERLLGTSAEGGNRLEDQQQEEGSITLDRIDRLLVLMEVILNLPLVKPVDPESSETSSSTTLLPALPSTSIIPGVFFLAHALPRGSLSLQVESTLERDDTISHSRNNLCARAQRIWESFVKSKINHIYNGKKEDEPPLQVVSIVFTSITQSLRTLLSNINARCTYRCSPEDIVAVFYVLRDSITAQASKEYLNSTLSMMNPVESLLPSQTSFDALLDQLNGAPISRSIGVVDELAGIASLFGSSTVTSNPDHTHAYARYALALLRILSDDLRLARGLLTISSSSWWVLRHLLVLGVYAEEVVMVPSAHESNPLFHLGMNQPGRVRRCREIIAKVHQIVAYVFASVESTEGEREWRKDLCHILSASTDTFMPTLPSVGSLLLSSIRFAAKTDSYRDCCVLGEVLSRVFQAGFGSVSTDGISEEESNSWLNYARKISEFKKGESAPAPLTGITIMSTLVANLPSSSSTTSYSFSRLDRYRNELASSLLGVPSSRAASDGLRILLTLVLGTAPDVESEVVFLPVQRAVNVIKACQKWIEEEEENGEEENDEGETGVKMEELESAMTLTFYHLAPILQNVPGGHWQFIFDVIENNIENCDFKFIKSLSVSHSSSPLQLLTLARTLRLIRHVQDLAATNKSLRAQWNERKDGIMKGIKSMILDGDFADEESEAAKGEGDHEIKSSDEPNSVPESVCRELVLELVANHLSDESMDHQTFSEMCHLLSSSTSRSSDITSFSSSLSHSSSSSLLSLSSPIHHAQLAFQILHKATKKYTEHFVLEAGVDTEGKLEAQLPKELMVLLQQSVNLDIDADDANLTGGREHAVFVYLLGWMLLFDLFVDTSMKVRMRYIDQLRNSSIIEEHFIPTVFSLLRLDRGIVKAYKLDMWAVNEFYVQFFEAGSSSGLQNFAAHLYYRALLTVPSLIYNWVVNCRDRQLSSTIAAYTQSHFSPVLIRAELEHVKSPEAQSEFASDENPLSVKVASGVVNEVTASYLVDEQQLEIRLRIPGDWPLHRIEIRDTKKVGVDDNRWRAWILGVQQTIWAQNGRIVDGLTLFKKNVTGHFEGQVECAICYSLINVNDGSLPKKPCNTCKNRFHAGCLYKWFNSSHSSSCPLCRSDILH